MKVSELAGAQLDYWVGKALGLTDEYLVNGQRAHRVPMFISCPSEDSEFGDMFEPSTRWDHGGPIKEKHRISTAYIDGYVRAIMPAQDVSCPGEGHTWPMRGSTELEAAMRCLVASKYGDEVEK